MEDDHVDRPGVEAQQCVKLTGPNRSIGLILPFAPRTQAQACARDARWHSLPARSQKSEVKSQKSDVGDQVSEFLFLIPDP